MIEANTSLVWRFVETFIYIAFVFSFILSLYVLLFDFDFVSNLVYLVNSVFCLMYYCICCVFVYVCL